MSADRRAAGSFLKRLIILHTLCALALTAADRAAAQGPDTRYNEYGFSFQPPAGWVQDQTVEGDVRVQYLGPQRSDRTRPVFSLVIQDQAIDLSDREVEALVNELASSFNSRRMEGTQVTDRRKTQVAGFNALQLDLAYKQGNLPTRLRQVYVPVSDHKRTYIFTTVDTQEHFDESVVATSAAINSFSPAGARAAVPAAVPGEGEGAGGYTLLLVLAGLMALVLIFGAIYLLLRGRKNAS